MMKNAARQLGYFDAVIVGSDGRVRESSAANLCIVSGVGIKTPPLSDAMLPGVTRAFVLAQAPHLGLEAIECDLTVEDLYAADEVLLTSTTINALPVTRVNEQLISQGTPGPVAAKLAERFAAAQ
jgi:D-alanine transaminase